MITNRTVHRLCPCLMILISVCLGCERSHDQRFTDAVQKVRDGQLQTIDIRHSPITGDQFLQTITGLNSLRNLNLDGSPVTDHGITSIGPLPHLEELSLTKTMITNKALPLIADQFPNLRTLRLDETRITDVGLSALKSMESLSDLSLYRTRITDEGCNELVTLPALRNLSIDQTAVTDEGLQRLATDGQLRRVSVWNTKVTEDVVKELAESHPNLKINR